MSSRTLLFRFALLAVLLILSLPAASGMTSSGWLVTPAGNEISPGTPVKAGFTLHFESWETGSTFDKDNSLMMSTDLASPHWSVKKSETIDDQQPPLIETLIDRQASQVRIDGWSISYARKKFDVIVELTGTAPAQNQSGTISIVKLQEMAPGSKVVASSIIKKEKLLSVPTPVPTIAPETVAITMTPDEVIIVTPEPTAPAEAITPTKKVTYSPGPNPVLIAWMLAGLVLLVRFTGRKE